MLEGNVLKIILQVYKKVFQNNILIFYRKLNKKI